MTEQTADSAQKRSIRIEHQVMGSLTTRPGDSVLSYTDGVSESAEALCTLADGVESTDHASLWVLSEPQEPVARFIHVQAQYTRFGGVRAYNTRAVYECSHADVAEAGGYAHVLGMLDRMRPYEQPEYGVAAEREVPVEVGGLSDDCAQDAALLRSCLLEGLATHCPVMIRLGADEMRYADDLRQSHRLLTLLQVIDELPQGWPSAVSVAFGVDSTSPFTQQFQHAFQVVAHFDDASLWDCPAGTVVADWTGDRLKVDPACRERVKKRRQLPPAPSAPETAGATAAPPVADLGEEDIETTLPRRRRSRWPVFLLLLALSAMVIAALIIYYYKLI